MKPDAHCTLGEAYLPSVSSCSGLEHSAGVRDRTAMRTWIAARPSTARGIGQDTICVTGNIASYTIACQSQSALSN